MVVLISFSVLCFKVRLALNLDDNPTVDEKTNPANHIKGMLSFNILMREAF